MGQSSAYESRADSGQRWHGFLSWDVDLWSVQADIRYYCALHALTLIADVELQQNAPWLILIWRAINRSWITLLMCPLRLHPLCCVVSNFIVVAFRLPISFSLLSSLPPWYQICRWCLFSVQYFISNGYCHFRGLRFFKGHTQFLSVFFLCVFVFLPDKLVSNCC